MQYARIFAVFCIVYFIFKSLADSYASFIRVSQSPSEIIWRANRSITEHNKARTMHIAYIFLDMLICTEHE